MHTIFSFDEEFVAPGSLTHRRQCHFNAFPSGEIHSDNKNGWSSDKEFSFQPNSLPSSLSRSSEKVNNQSTKSDKWRVKYLQALQICHQKPSAPPSNKRVKTFQSSPIAVPTKGFDHSKSIDSTSEFIPPHEMAIRECFSLGIRREFRLRKDRFVI